jgi:hypothetical protein
MANARVGHELAVPVTPDSVAPAFENVTGAVSASDAVVHELSQIWGASTIHSALD